MKNLLRWIIEPFREANEASRNASAVLASLRAGPWVVYKCRMCGTIMQVRPCMLFAADRHFQLRGACGLQTIQHVCDASKSGIADFVGVIQL